MVKFLIEEQGVDIYGQGVDCLKTACRHRHFDIVKYLLGFGISPKNVFEWASKKGHSDILLYLMEKYHCLPLKDI